MTRLKLVFADPSYDRLTTTSFRDFWDYPHEIHAQDAGSHQPRTDASPSGCFYKGIYYVVYKYWGTKDLWVAVYDSKNFDWYTQKICDFPDSANLNPRSSGHPTTVVFNGLLYAVYKSASTNEIYIAWFDGYRWYGDTKISWASETPLTNLGPHTVVYDNKLHVFYKGCDDEYIYYSWFDGEKWQGNATLPSFNGSVPVSATGPSAVVFNDQLYLFYRGGGNDDRLYVSWYNGAAWNGNSLLPQLSGSFRRRRKVLAALYSTRNYT